MGMNVDNCPKCGKIYVKNPREMCPACYKDIELQLEACTKHLRENRGITLQALSDATKVPVIQIIKFIREGRISIISAPNIAYPCEVCGGPIRDQVICDSCRQRLAKDIANGEMDRKRTEQLKKQDNQITYNIKDRLKDRLR